MSEKRFIRNIMGNIYDSETDKWFEEDWKGKPLDYDDDLIVFLNEQQAEIERLKEQLSLVCKAKSSSPYNSVKEVLRREIFGLDYAAQESANAWNHYCVLSKLFEEQYGEYWDNFD